MPPLTGLKWVQIRALAEQLAPSEAGEALTQAAESDLEASDAQQRMLADYLLGFTSGTCPPTQAVRCRRRWPRCIGTVFKQRCQS
jgi:hypothetical protein